MAKRHVPGRAFSLENGETYFSVKEAACTLGVSRRSVYGYLARGKLSRICIEGMIMLRAAEVSSFERQPPGRPRARPPLWHQPPELNPLYTTVMMVPVRPDCAALLEERLAWFRRRRKHHIPGTVKRFISCNENDPRRVTIALFWRGETLPPEELLEQSLAAFYADLADVLDWETAVIEEGQTFLHAGG